MCQAMIRKELNEFKSTEMDVHEESRQFTRLVGCCYMTPSLLVSINCRFIQNIGCNASDIALTQYDTVYIHAEE